MSPYFMTPIYHSACLPDYDQFSHFINIEKYMGYQCKDYDNGIYVVLIVEKLSGIVVHRNVVFEKVTPHLSIDMVREFIGKYSAYSTKATLRGVVIVDHSVVIPESTHSVQVGYHFSVDEYLTIDYGLDCHPVSTTFISPISPPRFCDRGWYFYNKNQIPVTDIFNIIALENQVTVVENNLVFIRGVTLNNLNKFIKVSLMTNIEPFPNGILVVI